MWIDNLTAALPQTTTVPALKTSAMVPMETCATCKEN